MHLISSFLYISYPWIISAKAYNSVCFCFSPLEMVCTNYFLHFLFFFSPSSSSSVIKLCFRFWQRLSHKCHSAIWNHPNSVDSHGPQTAFKIGLKFHTQILITASLFFIFTTRHLTHLKPSRLQNICCEKAKAGDPGPAFKIAVVSHNHPPAAPLGSTRSGAQSSE